MIKYQSQHKNPLKEVCRRGGTYSSKVCHPLGQLCAYVIWYTLKVKDHFGELGPVVLLPHLLLRVNILATSGRRSRSGFGSSIPDGRPWHSTGVARNHNVCRRAGQLRRRPDGLLGAVLQGLLLHRRRLSIGLFALDRGKGAFGLDEAGEERGSAQRRVGNVGVAGEGSPFRRHGGSGRLGRCRDWQRDGGHVWVRVRVLEPLRSACPAYALSRQNEQDRE